MEKQPLLNTYVNNVSMDETVHAIEDMIATNKKSYVVAINADVVMKIENDEYLKKVVDEARISGSDLVPELCKVAATKGYSIFIIGGKDGIAERAKDNLEKEHRDIKIVGTYAPPFGFEKDITELEKINKMISTAHPDLLIACFGCPKQEKWIYENYKNYDAKISICAGATVDFIAGNLKRAPKWMSNHGLEWLYRVTQDPQRLLKRYLVDDVKIIGLIRKYR